MQALPTKKAPKEMEEKRHFRRSMSIHCTRGIWKSHCCNDITTLFSGEHFYSTGRGMLHLNKCGCDYNLKRIRRAKENYWSHWKMLQPSPLPLLATSEDHKRVLQGVQSSWEWVRRNGYIIRDLPSRCLLYACLILMKRPELKTSGIVHTFSQRCCSN